MKESFIIKLESGIMKHILFDIWFFHSYRRFSLWTQQGSFTGANRIHYYWDPLRATYRADAHQWLTGDQVVINELNFSFVFNFWLTYMSLLETSSKIKPAVV